MSETYTFTYLRSVWDIETIILVWLLLLSRPFPPEGAGGGGLALSPLLPRGGGKGEKSNVKNKETAGKFRVVNVLLAAGPLDK